ncbi:MAP7 domain-containing protein 2 [Lampris incognitus]|uniref:MAP7 domain-containing protein 2 n=1 Tax=Lampris incognitus TaxID=2546036 RepID=UPI0024B4BCD5|nr:MAP7 domain-containing protein 2 [Lampris incognitus]
MTPPTEHLLTNRHASPSRPSSNNSSPAELSDQLRDKERRAQQYLERCAEERGRRMEEQRRKENLRRAAAEDKRRLQHGVEKERLEALVRRRTGGSERRGDGAVEALDSLESRPKRWTWEGPPDGVEGNPKTPPRHAIGSAQPNELPAASPASQSRNGTDHVTLCVPHPFLCHTNGLYPHPHPHPLNDFLTPPQMDQPISKRLSSSSAALHSPERASHGTQRPIRSSSNRRSIAGLPEESNKAKTPTTECPTTPVRSASFRTHGKGPGTPKRARSAKARALSPCSLGQYPPSPLRQRAPTPSSEDRGHPEGKGQGTLERKPKNETSEKKIPKSTSRELAAESPGTPTGRNVAGTTDAEEASRLLAERRRLARVQKEQEERQRQEEERLRAEEELRRREEARERQEKAAKQAEEERVKREEERKIREEEERRQKEQRWKNMQEQLDREREEAFLRAQREAERKRQERELLHIQEEQERLQRKKRIEEIMKRTRKSDVEPPTAGPVSEVRGQAGIVVEEEAATPAEAPVIMLGPLESKSCLDELSDGVQSMDVSSPSARPPSCSPVSRDEQASAQDFSPVTEGIEGVSNACTLEHLLDLAAQGRGQGQDADTPPYPKLQASSGAALGDLNKNLLIQACNAASGSSQLIHSLSPSKLDVQ